MPVNCARAVRRGIHVIPKEVSYAFEVMQINKEFIKACARV